MILAFDTSGDELLVAVVDDGLVLAGRAIPGPRHQDRIFEIIAEVAGDRLPGIAAVAVARGPGSQTGLRVGLAAASGIAFGRHLPIYPLSSLAVAAHRTSEEGPVLAVVSAGRGRVYVQEFGAGAEGLIAMGARRLLAIDEIDAAGRAVGAEPALLASLNVVAGEVRDGAAALAAVVAQAVSANEGVNYDGLSGDYGD